jgi:long-chain acyl-CoA synthetase
MQLLRAVPVEDPRVSSGRTLPQLLRDRARENGAAVAIRSKRAGVWRSLGWGEVYRRVRAYAAGLAALGLKRGEVIAFVTENCEEQFMLQIAALCIGARTVSSYPDASVDELRFLLEHSGAVMLVGQDQEQVDKVLAMPRETLPLRAIFYIDGGGLWSYDDPRLEPLGTILEREHGFAGDIEAEIDAQRQADIAVYCYTSGTTGRPKAAMLSHAFILDNAFRLMGSLQVEPGARYLSYISPAWAAEQYFGFGLALLAPMTVHFAEKPETVQSDLREVGPEFLMFTPRQWEMLASAVEAQMMMDAAPWRRRLYLWGTRIGRARNAPGAGAFTRFLAAPLADLLVLRGVRNFLGLSRARAVLSGGSGLSAELFTRFHAFGIPLGNLYGSTELGLVSTHRRGETDPATMGQLMPSDPTIAPAMEVWVDEIGQLRLRAPAFSGYLKNEAATAELGTSEQGFETGDAVRLDERGQLIFLDRLKDMRRLRDGQIYPPQFIENHLRSSSMIRDAIVIGDEERTFVTALVNIDGEIAGRYAETQGLAYGTFTELSQLEAIRAEVARAIASVNALVEPGARVRHFATLPKELDADESELTRSRKLRRELIHERYRDLIDALYGTEEHCHTTIEVKYQDGSISQFDTRVSVNRVEAIT